MPREWYANFGGQCPHPEYDKELFLRLPLSRRQEILEINRLAKEIPGIRAVKSVHPITWEPYPGQVTFDEFFKPKPPEAVRPAIQQVPDLPLWFLKLGNGHAPAPSDLVNSLVYTLAKTDVAALKERCVSNGHFGGSKPLDGITAYLWRLALVKSGRVATLPITARLDLEDGLEKLASVPLDVTQEAMVLNVLDGLADKLATSVG